MCAYGCITVDPDTDKLILWRACARIYGKLREVTLFLTSVNNPRVGLPCVQEPGVALQQQCLSRRIVPKHVLPIGMVALAGVTPPIEHTIKAWILYNPSRNLWLQHTTTAEQSGGSIKIAMAWEVSSVNRVRIAGAISQCCRPMVEAAELPAGLLLLPLLFLKRCLPIQKHLQHSALPSYQYTHFPQPFNQNVILCDMPERWEWNNCSRRSPGV